MRSTIRPNEMRINDPLVKKTSKTETETNPHRYQLHHAFYFPVRPLIEQTK